MVELDPASHGKVSSLRRIVRPFCHVSSACRMSPGVCVCVRRCVSSCKFYSHHETTRRVGVRLRKKNSRLWRRTARCLIKSDTYKLNCSANQQETLTGLRAKRSVMRQILQKDIAKNVQVDPCFLLSQCDLRVKARKLEQIHHRGLLCSSGPLM